MEKYFETHIGPSGNPRVPRSYPDTFVDIWMGSAAAFSALTWFNPHMWQLYGHFNWHDKVMLFEQHHWKKAREKKQPYKFQMAKAVRDSCYFNWPVYFP